MGSPDCILRVIEKWAQEISPILTTLDKEISECIIAGDFNLDLLKLNEREVFSELFYALTENNFYHKITLLTRFSIKHGTLIDNFYCKLTESTLDTISGILIKHISDHQPYFTFLNNLSQHKLQQIFIKNNIRSSEAMSNFENELRNMRNKIDNSPTADPNSNYSIIHKIIENAKNKHISSKIVKFNKRKRKKVSGSPLE